MSKGKNYSGNTNQQRSGSDFYQTPDLIAQDVVGIIQKHVAPTWNRYMLLDPSCGEGAIKRGLEGLNNKILHEFDLYPSQDYPIEAVDFLTHDFSIRFDAVVTNPPFKLAAQFIEKGLQVAEKVIYLLPLSYLHGKQRFDQFYNQGLLEAVYVYTRYPLLTEQKQTGLYKTGMMVYAWFVFSRVSLGMPPTISWLDNNHHIQNKKRGV